MKVVVVGKEHLSGVSRKTGKEFNSNLVHVSYVKNGVNGSAVETVWLDPVSFSLDSIQVGKTYDLDRDSRGFIVGFKIA